jgi:antitoxin (DNA-binding transcriptional repressor) of toxin-antitoxin stability system
MKTVEITEASLVEYGRKTAKETWVLTRRGKPVAAVVPILRGLDFETFSLSHNPDFIDLLNRSWAGYMAAGGISLKELKRKYGLKRTSAPRRRRALR